MQRHAEFSACRTYRYALWRSWNQGAPVVMFIGLNPSTADEHVDDPTVRRCIGYARTWRYGSLVMANLFAYRSTSPSDLYTAEDPVGPDNDRWLEDLAMYADLVVAAWGNHGQLNHRWKVVTSNLKNLYCLGMTKQRQPCHPLYLQKNLTPQRWHLESGYFG